MARPSPWGTCTSYSLPAFLAHSAVGQNEPCHSLRRHGRSTSASGPAGPAVGASESGHKIGRLGEISSVHRHAFRADLVATLTLPVAPSVRFSPSSEICLTFPGLQRARCWAGQTPSHARASIIEVNLAIHASLCRRFHDCSAEPASLRRRYRRPLALGPTHGEGIAIRPPIDIDATDIRRKRPVFAGIGGELMEREPDGLRGSRV